MVSSIALKAFKRLKRLHFADYCILIFPVASFGLGVWQNNRRIWKANILKNIDDHFLSSPVDLKPDVKCSLDLPEYYHVKVKGYFDHSKEVIIGPKQLIKDNITSNEYEKYLLPENIDQMTKSRLESFGYFIVTPFHLADDPETAILVNRGWVPSDKMDPGTRPMGQVTDLVELTGHIRYPENDAPFCKNAELNRCSFQKHQLRYFTRKIHHMAEVLNTKPIFIDSSYDSSIPGGPVGGQTRTALRDKHTSYMLFWFTLGSLMLGMWLQIYLF